MSCSLVTQWPFKDQQMVPGASQSLEKVSHKMKQQQQLQLYLYLHYIKCRLKQKYLNDIFA